MITHTEFNNLEPGSILNDTDGTLWKFLSIFTTLEGIDGTEDAETVRYVRACKLIDRYPLRFKVNQACKKFTVMEHA